MTGHASLALFIGRAREVDAVMTLLGETGVRLVTITGPPGVGKTRLALEVGSKLQDSFERGVHVVNLGSLQDPDLVPHTIMQSLGLVAEQSPRPRRNLLPSDQVARYLRNKRTLLILDNFEHLLSAGPLVSRLLDDCPDVKIVVTSREALRLRSEREYILRPLPVPPPDRASDPGTLRSEPALALFVDRARLVSSDFALTPANATIVLEICRRLDGLPLAIELAAARMRVLSPHDLLAHLGKPFDLLTGRYVNGQARHQSFYEAIAWSYHLLTPQEQTLFRRLAVFRGGFTLEAAQTVLGLASSYELIDDLALIVERSLLSAIHTKTGKTRYVFLESLRQFAALELEAAGEAPAAHAAHAAYFSSLAGAADEACNGPEQAQWFDAIEEEIDNFRAALQWSLDHDPISALRIAVELIWFWQLRGYFAEANRWYAESLERAKDASSSLRARALAAHGLVLLELNIEESIRASTQGLQLARSAGDHIADAFCLRNLGLAVLEQGDFATAEAHYAARLSLHTRFGPAWATASTYQHMAALARAQGDIARSADLARRNLEISRPAGNTRVMASGMATLGWAAFYTGDLERAAELFEESMQIHRELGAVPRVSRSQASLGEVALRRGDRARARRLVAESLSTSERIGHRYGFADSLLGLGVPLIASEDPHRAARWLGFAHGVREEIGIVTYPVDRADADRLMMTLRERLGEAEFDKVFAKGREISIEQVLKEVESAFDPARDILEEPVFPVLSPREREVANLVAAGLSNSAIAARLHIGVRTAETHVQSIMNKLGFHSRSQIAAWVAEQKSG